MPFDERPPEEPSAVRGLLWDGGWIGTSVKLNTLAPGMGAGSFSMVGLAAKGGLKMAGISPRLLENPVIAPLLGGHFNLNWGLKGGGSALDQAVDTLGMKHMVSEGFEGPSFYKTRGFSRLAVKTGFIDESTLLANRTISKAIFKDVAGMGFKGAAARWGATRVGMALGTRVLPVVGWAVIAYDVARASAALYDNIKELGRIGNKQRRAQLTTPLANSFEAQTTRRQGLLAIQQSRLNARSAFGHEARHYHSV